MAYKVVRSSPRKRVRNPKGRLARKASKYGVKYEERRKKREEKRAARKKRTPGKLEDSKEYRKMDPASQRKASTAMRYTEWNQRMRSKYKADAAMKKRKK